MRKPNTFFPARLRRGFTITEMAVAMAVGSVVFATVGAIQYISARSVSEIYGQAHTRSSRMQALDQIRYRICEAEIGTVVLSQTDPSGTGFHRIEFDDPNIPGTTSAFWFVEADRELYYDEDIKDGVAARVVVTGPINISFDTISAGAIVQLHVRTLSDMNYATVDSQDGDTQVYLRNM